jgi:hypothetical protein
MPRFRKPVTACFSRTPTPFPIDLDGYHTYSAWIGTGLKAAVCASVEELKVSDFNP